MQKFIVISAAINVAGKAYKNGDVIELDKAQAARPFYKQRTRPATAAAVESGSGSQAVVAALEAQVADLEAQLEVAGVHAGELVEQLATADARIDELEVELATPAKAPSKK